MGPPPPTLSRRKGNLRISRVPRSEFGPMWALFFGAISRPSFRKINKSTPKKTKATGVICEFRETLSDPFQHAEIGFFIPLARPKKSLTSMSLALKCPEGSSQKKEKVKTEPLMETIAPFGRQILSHRERGAQGSPFCLSRAGGIKLLEKTKSATSPPSEIWGCRYQKEPERREFPKRKSRIFKNAILDFYSKISRFRQHQPSLNLGFPRPAKATRMVDLSRHDPFLHAPSFSASVST